MLVRLTYISTPVGDQGKALGEFLPGARTMNDKFSITGFMVVAPTFYFQQLEGDHVPVNRLYKNLLADKRHKDCYLIEYEEVRELRFPSWSMAVSTLPKPVQAIGDSLAMASLPNGKLAEAGRQMLALVEAELKINKYMREWL